MEEAFLSYCTTYKEKCFKTEKGDIFMWVSGKHHLMNIDTLMEVAETPEEIELVSKVMIRYSRHCKEGYWFDDMKEPELSMVLLRADSGRCRFYSTSCRTDAFS